MMYIFYNKEGQRRVVSVHTGEKLSKVFRDSKTVCEEIEYVHRVQADCDELNLINNVLGFPFLGKLRVVNYYGDDAKFIAGNWDAASR